MKNLLKIVPILMFFVLVPALFSAEAAYLKFDKTTATAASGATFQVAVMVEPGTDSLSSTDVYVTYDATLLKATVVTSGTQFPTVTNDIATAGKVYIAGMVNDPASSISTSGTLATITFQGLKDGSGTLAFDCNLSKIIKNDLNATNVISCSQNVSSAVTIGAGGGGATSPTATPTPGGSSGNTGNTTPTTAPSVLPQSGVFDNVAAVAIPGMIILFIGLGIRLIL